MAPERNMSRLPGPPDRHRVAGRAVGNARPASHRKSRTPRGHWVLVTLVMIVFTVGLLVEGYTRGELGVKARKCLCRTHSAAPLPVGWSSDIDGDGSRMHSYRAQPGLRR